MKNTEAFTHMDAELLTAGSTLALPRCVVQATLKDSGQSVGLEIRTPRTRWHSAIAGGGAGPSLAGRLAADRDWSKAYERLSDRA